MLKYASNFRTCSEFYINDLPLNFSYCHLHSLDNSCCTLHHLYQLFTSNFKHGTVIHSYDLINDQKNAEIQLASTGVAVINIDGTHSISNT